MATAGANALACCTGATHCIRIHVPVDLLHKFIEVIVEHALEERVGLLVQPLVREEALGFASAAK